MEIHEPHGQRFQIALELLHEGKFFVFDGVRFSLSDQQLVVAIESSFWPNVSEPTACADLHRARNIAEYLAKESAEFASVYQNHQHLYLLLNYYGHGGEIEARAWSREGSFGRKVCLKLAALHNKSLDRSAALSQLAWFGGA
jgi:hypothetical protein